MPKRLFCIAAALAMTLVGCCEPRQTGAPTHRVRLYSGGCVVAEYRARGTPQHYSSGFWLFTTAGGSQVQLDGTVTIEEL